MRALVDGMGHANAARQQPLTPRHEFIPRHRVVKGDDRRQNRGHEQHAHHGGQGPAEIAPRQLEQEHGGVGIALQGRHQRINPDAHDHQPGRQRVKNADHHHRQIGGARHGAGGIAGLFGIDRRRFKADKGGKAEQKADRRHARGDLAEAERLQVQPRCSARHQNGDVEQHHDQELQPDQNHQNPGRQIDLTVSQNGHDQDGEIRPDVPRQRQAEFTHGSGGDCAEQAQQADLHGVIGEYRHHQRGTAHAPAKTGGGKGIERPGVFQMPCHRNITHGKDQQDDGHDGERASDARTIAKQHRRWHPAADRRQRCRRRHHHECDRADAKAVASEFIRAGCGSHHSASPAGFGLATAPTFEMFIFPSCRSTGQTPIGLLYEPSVLFQIDRGQRPVSTDLRLHSGQDHGHHRQGAIAS